MNFDFATILVTATFLTGGIWALDAWLWAPKRRVTAQGALPGQGAAGPLMQEQEAAREPVIVEYAKAFFPVILIVLILRSFLVEPFRIPSGSMMPTLLDGDFILVNKFGYGIRLPVLNTKIIEVGDPKRGDVVVFRFPRDPSVDYIKRIVGLPGDRIVYRDKVLYINDEPMKQELIGTYTGTGTGMSMTGHSLRIETLANVRHEILTRPEQPPRNAEFRVPEGHYFVMGDNRDNSNDSRFWGFVPDENLVGKAFMIWMNWDSADKTIRWERLGSFIE